MPPKKPAADSADPPAPSSSDAPVKETKSGLSAHGLNLFHSNRCDVWEKNQTVKVYAWGVCVRGLPSRCCDAAQTCSSPLHSDYGEGSAERVGLSQRSVLTSDTELHQTKVPLGGFGEAEALGTESP